MHTIYNLERKRTRTIFVNDANLEEIQNIMKILLTAFLAFLMFMHTTMLHKYNIYIWFSHTIINMYI